MRLLKIEPVIYKYDDCRAFCECFKIGKDDLIITSKEIYCEFLHDNIKESAVIFIENYGSGYASESMVESIYESTKKMSFERVIAIGNRSVLDVGKIFALKNISPVNMLFQHKLEIIKERELILVPTTFGHTSEITNRCFLEFDDKNKKELAVDELFADSTILIPQLMKSISFNTFAVNSISVFIQAVESYLSPKATEHTQLFSEKAIKIILDGYKKLKFEGKQSYCNVAEDFPLAGNYSGIAISNTGYGMINLIGYNLSLRYDISQIDAEYAVFIDILRKYAEVKSDNNIKKFNALITDLLDCSKDALYDELEKILNYILPKKNICKYGAEEEELISKYVNK